MKVRKIAIVVAAAAGVFGMAPVADAASAGLSFLKSDENAKTYVIEVRRRGRGPRVHLPLGPGYVYYDYPYYYSRGHYPTHIVGYIYYPNLFARRHYPGYGVRCATRSCVASWRYSKKSAMPRRSRGACRCL